MRQLVEWTGWLTLLAGIIAGTVMLFNYWSPRDGKPEPPPEIVTVPTPPTPEQAELERLRMQVQVIRRQRQLEQIRARQDAIPAGEKVEARCYSGELFIRRNGAWENVGRC